MGLIVGNVINPQLFKGQQIILFGLLADFFEPCCPRLLRSGQLLGDRAPLVTCTLTNSILDGINFLLDVALHVVIADFDRLESRMRHDHCIPVMGRNAREHQLAPCTGQIVFRRSQHLGSRICLHEAVGEVQQHVVWNHEHHLLRLAQSLQLHTGADHLQRLPRSDRMGQKRVVPTGNYPPHCITLVRAQGVDTGHPWQNQVGAIKLLCHHRAKQQVVLACKHFCPLAVLPDPFHKGVFEYLLLLTGHHRLAGIHLALPIDLVVDGGLALVQLHLKQCHRIHTAGAVCLCRFHRSLQAPRSIH